MDIEMFRYVKRVEKTANIAMGAAFLSMGIWLGNSFVNIVLALIGG